MSRPVRVLHVVGAMNRGGVESWLMALLRHADRSDIAMDFLVHTTRPAAYDDEIAALGGSVIPCAPVHRPSYVHDFSAVLRDRGPYDVVHSHVHWFSGLTTSLARHSGVPLRIAHSHSNTSVPEASAGVLRAGYRMLMRRGIFLSATHLAAASEPAASALFGPDWRQHPRANVLYCGVDFTPFAASDPGVDRQSIREEFSIDPADVVIGHVGSFGTPKNHAFLCSVAATAAKRKSGVCVLCVGVGPLQEDMRERCREAGVRVVFAGLRTDIPRLLRAMDVFVFPSLYEGLPLAVVEAQAAGLPCVVSSAVTREVDVVPGLIRWLPLSAGPTLWADIAMEAAKVPAQAVTGLAAMRQSPFNVESSFKKVHAIYHT